MKPLHIFLIALFLPLLSSAQKLEGGVFLGGANYVGDVVVPDFFDLSNTNFAYGLLIRHSFQPKLALRGNLLFGKIQGNDADYDDPSWRQDRAFSFESPLTEISLQLEWSPLTKQWYNTSETGDTMENKVFQKSWSPYIFAGIGGVFFDPVTNYNTAANGELKDEISIDQNADYSTFNVNFPMGVGVKFDLSEKAVLGIEGGVRPPITDYLDGVSVAGNSDKDDWYGFGGLTLTFRLGETNTSKEEMVEEEVKVMDADGDGVEDANDLCPTVAGKAMFGGCPDTDNDGIADKDDPCPTLSGNLGGCPDSDNDGIADKDDKCPNEKGIASEEGCPKKELDSDGDGVLDAVDRCPNTAGISNLGGCPDSDGDGIADRDDRCPNLAGIARFGGCADGDSDGDGVLDSQDKCPNSAGSISNNGCPTISAADRSTLDLAIRNIRFETSSNILKSESNATLDKIADIMMRYPSYDLRISGHTDSVGDSASNQRLSEKRAKACYDYLVRRGVSSSKMSHSGYGETRPIASNSDSEGRRMNRRVEFELFLR